MKVAILAGGVGSRLMEETDIKPKPMVEIGGQPILLHIMRHYAQYGHSHFIVHSVIKVNTSNDICWNTGD